MSLSNRPSIELQPLKTSLRDTPADRTAQFNLLKALLGLTCSEPELKRVNLAPFFKFYAEWCDFALTDGGRYLSCQTHEELIAIAECIREGQTREEIQNALRATSANNAPQAQSQALAQVKEDAMNGSIDLAAGLLLMTAIGRPRFGSLGYEVLEWTTGTLEGFIGRWFDEQKTGTGEYVRLERTFHALSLELIAGMRIELSIFLLCLGCFIP